MFAVHLLGPTPVLTTVLKTKRKKNFKIKVKIKTPKLKFLQIYIPHTHKPYTQTLPHTQATHPHPHSNSSPCLRNSASSLVPKHAAVACFFKDQDGFHPMPEDRGAELGDVDGPLECGLALGMIAAEARLRVAVQQAARTLPCVGTRPTGRRTASRRTTQQDATNSKLFSSEAGKPIGADDP